MLHGSSTCNGTKTQMLMCNVSMSLPLFHTNAMVSDFQNGHISNIAETHRSCGCMYFLKITSLHITLPRILLSKRTASLSCTNTQNSENRHQDFTKMFIIPSWSALNKCDIRFISLCDSGALADTGCAIGIRHNCCSSKRLFECFQFK